MYQKGVEETGVISKPEDRVTSVQVINPPPGSIEKKLSTLRAIVNTESTDKVEKENRSELTGKLEALRNKLNFTKQK